MTIVKDFLMAATSDSGVQGRGPASREHGLLAAEARDDAKFRSWARLDRATARSLAHAAKQADASLGSDKVSDKKTLVKFGENISTHPASRTNAAYQLRPEVMDEVPLFKRPPTGYELKTRTRKPRLTLAQRLKFAASGEQVPELPLALPLGVIDPLRKEDDAIAEVVTNVLYPPAGTSPIIKGINALRSTMEVQYAEKKEAVKEILEKRQLASKFELFNSLVEGGVVELARKKMEDTLHEHTETVRLLEKVKRANYEKTLLSRQQEQHNEREQRCKAWLYEMVTEAPFNAQDNRAGLERSRDELVSTLTAASETIECTLMPMASNKDVAAGHHYLPNAVGKPYWLNELELSQAEIERVSTEYASYRQSERAREREWLKTIESVTAERDAARDELLALRVATERHETDWILKYSRTRQQHAEAMGRVCAEQAKSHQAATELNSYLERLSQERGEHHRRIELRLDMASKSLEEVMVEKNTLLSQVSSAHDALLIFEHVLCSKMRDLQQQVESRIQHEASRITRSRSRVKFATLEVARLRHDYLRMRQSQQVPQLEAKILVLQGVHCPNRKWRSTPYPHVPVLLIGAES